MTLAVATAGMLLVAGGAQAAELATGTYFGSGNDYFPGNWTVTTANNYEVALRAHEYQEVAPAPTGNLYVFSLGQIVSLDFSFDNLHAVPSRTDIQDLTSTLTITNAAGGSASYNALLTPDNAQNPNGKGGEQNSLRFSFDFLNGIGPNVGDINYDANTNSTYTALFTVSGANFAPLSSQIQIQQGSGFAVPEPGAWALMILGFGATGVMLRRRNLTLA